MLNHLSHKNINMWIYKNFWKHTVENINPDLSKGRMMPDYSPVSVFYVF